MSCRYCDMMLAYSELTNHEDYCGSRTEPCAMCDRYIMLRELEAHRQTNCEYPFFEQKNESEDAADWNRDFGHPFGGPLGYSILPHDLPEHLLEMPVVSHLQDVFRPMVLRDIRHEESPEDRLLGVRLRQSGDDPPPPYYLSNNTGDVHASNRPVVREERDSADDSDYDDDGKSFLLLNLKKNLKLYFEYFYMLLFVCTFTEQILHFMHISSLFIHCFLFVTW